MINRNEFRVTENLVVILTTSTERTKVSSALDLSIY